MKRKWTFWTIICSLGIPQFLLFVCGEIFVMRWYYEEHYRRPYVITSISEFENLFMWAGFFWLFVVLKNSLWLGTEKKIGLLTWMEKYKYEPPSVSPRRFKAQHPPVPDEYLSDTPEGLVLGRLNKKYVMFPIKKGNALSGILLGTPGSGKSTLILTTLIHQLHKKLLKGEQRQVFFTIDVKPELMRKSTKPNSRVRELSILDRSQYGWDVFYALSPDATDDDILDEFDIVARALIDAGKSTKNEFFYESARTIFKFIALEQYKKGRSFIQIMDYFMAADMKELVIKTLEKAEQHPDMMKIKRGLAGYRGKEGEAFQGIEMSARQGLEVFQRDDTKFFFSNPRMVSPLTLEEKISIFFTMKSKKIKKYKTVIRLVIMQLLDHCEDRDEDDSHLITLIIDEAYRFGLINWIDFMSVCRSKNVSCILAFQGLSQMQSVWSREDADSLLEMVSFIAVLSCKSDGTTKLISSWAGEYYEEKINVTDNGNKGSSTSRSFELRKIVQPSDIMELKRKKEIILFLDGQYCRVNFSKAQYFNIPELNEISKACVEAHKRIKERGDINVKSVRKSSAGANASNKLHNKKNLRLEQKKTQVQTKKDASGTVRPVSGQKNKTSAPNTGSKASKNSKGPAKTVVKSEKSSKASPQTSGRRNKNSGKHRG